MKRNLVKLVSIVLSICLLCTNWTIYASESNKIENIQGLSTVSTGPSVYMTANEKLQFAAEKEALVAKQLRTYSNNENRKNLVEELLLKIAIEEDKDLINAQLESLGVYKFTGAKEIIGTKAGGGIIINTPDIYYTTGDATWNVVCGGKWTDDSWMAHAAVGEDIGNPDGFGVGYTNISGQYKTRVVKTTGALNNAKTGTGYIGFTTSNRSDGDGRYGFGFRMQDYVTDNVNNPEFIGKGWSGVCTYTSDFAYYNGIATAYYVHTWSRANISSVSFNVSGSPAGVVGGINIQITNNQYSRKEYSADASF